MNKSRRMAINEIIGTLNGIKDDIAGLRDEEQEYMDNMPEGLQGSERHEQAESAISGLEDAEGEIDEAIGNLEAAEEA